MATALTSHQHQLQHSHQIKFSVPVIPAPSPDNFCKECGLAFESYTSLEVHLSYHRSNLLSRWASQEPNSSSTPNSTSNMESKFPPKPETHPTPIAPSNIPPYYVHHHGNYALHPQYHHNGGENQRHQYAPPIDSQHYDLHSEQREYQKERSVPPPEEILDLDSNKVHIYNLPQQQVQFINTNNFYRPYLMSQPSNSPGLAGIGPNSAPPHVQHRNLPHSPPFLQDPQLYRTGSPHQSRSPSNVLMSSYEYSHIHHHYGPPLAGPPESQGLTFNHPPPTGGNQHFRGYFPPTQFSDASSSPDPTMSSPRLLMPSLERKKKVKVKAVPVNGNNDDSNSPATPKTKGWKGGECKRPKTYNCTACNKWFTSSGHLKRHYGTTLHKNSLRQRGENLDEESQEPLGKKCKAQQMKPKRSSADDCNGSGMNANNDLGHESLPLRVPIKSEDLRSGNPSPPPRVNGGNQPDISQRHTTSPAPTNTNAANYLHVYHGGHQGSPPQSLYGVNMGMSSQFHPPLGYEAQGLMGNSNVYTLSVPTSIYNGGYPGPLMSSDLSGSSLPPFGSVLSPYEQQSFQGLKMASNAPIYLHHRNVGPPPGSPLFDTESGIYSNSTSDGNDLKNEESPEAARCVSAASGLELSDNASNNSHSGSTGFSSGSECEHSGPVTPTVVTQTKGNVIKCLDCSKTFNRTCYLTQHANSSHLGGKPFKCLTCGKRFPEEPILSDHIAKHGNNKPYKCDLCPKQFNHKTDLRRHLCLHSGEKPFTCSFCGKGFIRKDHMSKHCGIHRKVNA